MSVRLGNHISKETFFKYGVSQGLILGPILFNIYVNDLSGNIDGFLVQYADNTQFLHSGKIQNLDQLIKDTEEILAQYRMFYLKNRQFLSHIASNITSKSVREKLGSLL